MVILIFIKMNKTVSLTSPPFLFYSLPVYFLFEISEHIVIEKSVMVILSCLQGTGTCANSVGKVQFLNNCLTISFQNVNLYSAFKTAYILNKEHRKKLQFFVKVKLVVT